LHGEDLVHPYRNVPTPVTTQADERETSQPDTLTARALANLLWALPLLRFLVRRRDGLDDIARIADIGERRDNLVATELTRGRLRRGSHRHSSPRWPDIQRSVMSLDGGASRHSFASIAYSDPVTNVGVVHMPPGRHGGPHQLASLYGAGDQLCTQAVETFRFRLAGLQRCREAVHGSGAR